MSKELIERLRADAESTDDIGLCADAAERIEQLERKVASRDVEVAKLKDYNEYLYVAAIERDQLSEQLEQTRTNDRIAMQYLADIKAALGHDGDYPSLIALAENLREQLTEREKQVTILRGYCEAQLRKDKAASYERCLDCDYEQSVLWKRVVLA